MYAKAYIFYANMFAIYFHFLRLVGWLVDNEQTKIKITGKNNDYENVHRWRLGCVPDRKKITE